MGERVERKHGIFIPEEHERIVPFHTNGQSGRFVWDDKTSMYSMEVDINGSGELLPHWKLSPALKEHLTKQNHGNEIPPSGTIYEAAEKRAKVEPYSKE